MAHQTAARVALLVIREGKLDRAFLVGCVAIAALRACEERHRPALGYENSENLGGLLVDDVYGFRAFGESRNIEETVPCRQVKEMRASAVDLGFDGKTAVKDRRFGAGLARAFRSQKYTRPFSPLPSLHVMKHR